jgi:hypothetical protein
VDGGGTEERKEDRVLDKRVDNPDYENSRQNEYPIGNLNARYRCFLAEPFHGFSPR